MCNELIEALRRLREAVHYRAASVVAGDPGQLEFADRKMWEAHDQAGGLLARPLVTALAEWQMVPKKITADMMHSALVAHYGKVDVEQSGGAAGIDMAARGVNYSAAQALRRLWKGALAAAPVPPAQVAHIDARIAAARQEGAAQALERADEACADVLRAADDASENGEALGAYRCRNAIRALRSTDKTDGGGAS